MNTVPAPGWSDGQPSQIQEAGWTDAGPEYISAFFKPFMAQIAAFYMQLPDRIPNAPKPLTFTPDATMSTLPLHYKMYVNVRGEVLILGHPRFTLLM